jgi:hypothetical protein
LRQPSHKKEVSQLNKTGADNYLLTYLLQDKKKWGVVTNQSGFYLIKRI